MSIENDPLLLVLREAANEEDLWKTTAMATLTVRFPDGTFKKTPVAAGDPPMFFRRVRAGKRADYIFEFAPADHRPYEAIEMDEKQVFKMLPGFEEHIVVAMGYGTKDVSGGEHVSFAKARGLFKRDHERREKERLAEEAASAARGVASRYEGNTLWGAFA